MRVVATAMLVASAGCSVPFSLKPSQVAVADGTGRGTTSQGKAISLTVKNHTVTAPTMTYGVSQPGCPMETTDAVAPGVALTPVLLHAGYFSHRFQSPSIAAAVDLFGSFEPAAPFRVSGQFTVTINACPGTTNASWQATKE